MKKRYWLFALVVIGLSQGAWSNDHVAETASTTSVGLSVVGDLSSDQLERIRHFVEWNAALPVQIRDLEQPDDIAALADLPAAIVDQGYATDAAWVIIVAESNPFSEHSIYNYDLDIAIINAGAIWTDDEETLLRRLEKLTMRAYGLLFDAPLVPNPHSALWAYRTIEELDAMGRNFDPPSLKRVQENAVARGVSLFADSPFLIVRD